MRLPTLLLVLVVLVVAACTGEEDGSEVAATSVPAASVADPTTSAPTTTEAEPSSPAEPIITRLEDAGFSVQEAEVQDLNRPVPVAEFDVSLGAAEVTVYVHASSADAAKEIKEFASVERDFPDGFEVRRVGRVLYVGTIEEPAKLPMRRYLRVVRVGGDAA